MFCLLFLNAYLPLYLHIIINVLNISQVFDHNIFYWETRNFDINKKEKKYVKQRVTMIFLAVGQRLGTFHAIAGIFLRVRRAVRFSLSAKAY